MIVRGSHSHLGFACCCAAVLAAGGARAATLVHYAADRIEVRLTPDAAATSWAMLVGANADAASGRPSASDARIPAYSREPGPDAANRALLSAGVATPASLRATARLARLGVARVDRAAASLGGVWFEPEFLGETPPTPGSGRIDFTAFYVAHLSTGVPRRAALAAFGALADVASVDSIGALPVTAIPNDSLWTQSSWFYQPSRRDIHAPEGWDVTTGDTSIVVAILDTGVIPYHPDMAGRGGERGQMWVNWAEVRGAPGVDDDANGFVDDFSGWDFVHLDDSSYVRPGEDWRDADNDPNDFAGHGTPVAGLVGAIANNQIGLTGVAWKVQLMPLRVGYSTPLSPLGEVDMLYAAQAVRYATRAGASVINCSFATVNFGGLSAAVDDAVQNDVVVVSAAGNNGSEHYLGSRDDVLSVTSIDDQDVVSRFSSLDGYVDVAAPGEGLVSTSIVRAGADSVSLRQPGYVGAISGTSFSAPLVAGVAALVQARQKALGRRPLLSNEMTMRIAETADDISAANPGMSGYGSGRVNLQRALTDPQGSYGVPLGSPSTGAPFAYVDAIGRHLFVIATEDERLLTIDGADGSIVRSFPLDGLPQSSIAAADLHDGHGPAMFVATDRGTVYGFDLEGGTHAGWPVSPLSPGNNTGVALGDVDGDGELDVVCGDTGGRIWAWHADGTSLAGFPVVRDGQSFARPLALAELDGLAGVEIVAAAVSGQVDVLRAGGAERVGWPIHVPSDPTGVVITRATVGQLPRVIISSGTHVFARLADGSSSWSINFSSVVLAECALGDLDGDGREEVVAPGSIDLAVVDPASGLARPGWPRHLSDYVVAPPLIGRFATTGRQLLLRIGDSLVVIPSGTGAELPFHRPGRAGTRSTITELAGDGATYVLAGTGSDANGYVYRVGSGTWDSSPLDWPTARGNFARTGSSGYAPSLAPPTYPITRRVVDLAAHDIDAHSAALCWTAPPPDSLAGEVIGFDLRWSAQPIDSVSFASATHVNANAYPVRPGDSICSVVEGLTESDTIFAAVRCAFGSGVGPVSNLAVTQTGSVPPAAVHDLEGVPLSAGSVVLRWTGVGDDGLVGTPRRYVAHAAHAVGDSAVWDTISVTHEWNASGGAGGSEEHVFDGLVPGGTYWFSLRAEDAAGNRSGLSNVVEVEVPSGFLSRLGAGVGIAARVQPARVPMEFLWQGAPGSTGLGWTITLYDLNGRRVRRLTTSADEHAGVVKWNGRDDEGRSVPAGVYFARLLGGSFHASTRVVLLP